MSTSISVLICIAYKSNKKLLHDDNNERYTYFIWIIISISLSFTVSLIAAIFGNDLFINWIFGNNNNEYFKMNIIRTTVDGIGTIFYMLSKFASYIVFSLIQLNII